MLQLPNGGGGNGSSSRSMYEGMLRGPDSVVGHDRNGLLDNDERVQRVDQEQGGV